MDWKNKLEKSIDINSMLAQYEHLVKMLKHNVKDLERKNKVLHKTTYLAHQKLGEWIEECKIEMEDAEPIEGITLDKAKELADELTKRFRGLQEEMESIISTGLSEPVKKIITEIGN